MKRFAAAFALCLLAAAARGQDVVGGRIAASAAGAEGLQGALDGTWTLTDNRGRTLFVIQIGDPPTGGATLPCAWRDPKGQLGLADCARHGRRLTLRFGARAVVLERDSSGSWRGVLRQPDGARAATLRRG
jgi:hypothetical protein